jgi:hypothetical protein
MHVFGGASQTGPVAGQAIFDLGAASFTNALALSETLRNLGVSFFLIWLSNFPFDRKARMASTAIVGVLQREMSALYGTR